MAITTTVNSRTIFGNKRIVEGASVLSGGSSSGAVVTGLSRVEQFFVTVKGTSQQGHSVSDTLPLSSGNVTVYVETANSTFYWMAIGK